jgi:hypothetical protein
MLKEKRDMARPTAKAIREAARTAQLNLTEDDANKLEMGNSVTIDATRVQAALAGCSGIKIVDLGGGCGLYLTPFPPSISVCCQT